MGINLGLRLLALSLSAVLLLLMAYYFLVVNRNLTPRLPSQGDSLKILDGEKRKADAVLMSKVKSAISQTKRLHGYGIGVECKDGLVTLTGDVPTEIDKELAANLARETYGVRTVNNQIRIAPDATPQPGEIVNPDLTINVDDLELQANVRERIISVPELKAQRIEVKVQNRAVTLSGRVASEAQRLRAEQLVQNYPKVVSVNNQLRLGTASTPALEKPSPSSTLAQISEQDRNLAQSVASALSSKAENANLATIKVTAQNGEITLSGTVSSRTEIALAEQLTKEVTGVRSVKNLLVVGNR